MTSPGRSPINPTTRHRPAQDAQCVFHARVGDLCDRLKRLCTVALLAVLVGLAPLAHASPPDPLWIAGIYDGADSDDAVQAAMATLESWCESDLPTVYFFSILAAIPLTADLIPDAPRLRCSPARAPPRNA